MAEHNHEQPLEKALAEEGRRFEEFYLWLKEGMPSLFFAETDPNWVPLIVHSLMHFKVQDYFAEIHLKNTAITLCLDSLDADRRILESYLLYGIKNYTTYVSKIPLPIPELKESFLRVASIQFTEAVDEPVVNVPLAALDPFKEALSTLHPHVKLETWHKILCKMDPHFLRKIPASLHVTALDILYRAEEEDLCQYKLTFDEQWKEANRPSAFFLVAWKNAPKHAFLYKLAKMVHRHGLVMRRVSGSYIEPHTPRSVLLLAFGLDGEKGQAAWETTDMDDFLRELVMLKYSIASDRIDTTFVQNKLISGNLSSLLRSIKNFLHQIFVHVDPNLYTLENIEEGLIRHPELTVRILHAFEAKFHPTLSNLERYEEIRREFLELTRKLDTGQEFHDKRRRLILLACMNFIEHLLKTNFYLFHKAALAFRLDPALLDKMPFDRKKIFPELPYGIFYIKGMHFTSFHIRFQDLARGGLRTVFPDKKERMLAELPTVFSECYNLAYTQQKKNKDIPEGGSKAVLFLKTYEWFNYEIDIYADELTRAGVSAEKSETRLANFREEQRMEFLYESQRVFIKSLLNLVNCESDGKLKASNILDYWQKPEYLYLGPDENMHNTMLDWIANESKRLGYRPGGAFISSKPKLGINHKEYGVTSLGVHVFVDEVLQFLGIDPKTEPFTIKMTGGPDGDVAGNEIHNLYRFYPNTAKLLALTDVSGSIYDPAGLELAACNILFREGKPIRYYPPEKLSPGGFLLDRETRKEETPYVSLTLCWRNKGGKLEADWLSGSEMNALYRNNVHRTKTDLFVPCGGRPRTLRDTNYKDFLDGAGQPTSRAIVEGANLYLSPWARHYLEEKGTIIIKDSSANKGGVICSSFEVLSSLALTEEEFAHHKNELVQEILEKIAQVSLDEARLLLKTYTEEKRLLTEISEDISTRINLYFDELLAFLNNVTLSTDPEDPLIRCFLAYCPKLLREQFQERLFTRIPDNHKKAVIACYIASRLVYQRGLNWHPSLVDILPVILQDPAILPDF